MFDPLPVHPVAALFPMLADDELQELAADIKQRGLLQPIVLDAEGRVLDGRNRLAACDIAGVVPNFEAYDGDDPDGYALAVNIARRHLSKGQRAMLMALSGYKNYTEAEVSKQYVSWARKVMGYEDLSAEVVAGTKPLARAYEIATERSEATAAREAKLTRLRTQAPDLADHVDGVRMDLDEAIAALQHREEKAQREAEAARQEAEARASEEERKRREQADVDRAHAARVSDSFRTIIGRTLVLYKTPELRAEVARIYGADLGDAMPAEVNAGTIREAGDILHMIADEWKRDRT